MIEMRPCDVMVNLKNWNFERDPKYPLTEFEAEAVIKALEEYKQKVFYVVEKSSVDDPETYEVWDRYDNLDMAKRAVRELTVCSWVADARINEVYE